MKNSERWCRTMHAQISWPMHGWYRCLRCNRAYAVPWANDRRFVAVPAAHAQGGLLMWWQRLFQNSEGPASLPAVPMQSSRGGLYRN